MLLAHDSYNTLQSTSHPVELDFGMSSLHLSENNAPGDFDSLYISSSDPWSFLSPLAGSSEFGFDYSELNAPPYFNSL